MPAVIGAMADLPADEGLRRAYLSV